MDLLLDGSGDLVFTNGECPTTSSLVESVMQRTKVRLLTFYGEWFLNTDYGVPYFQRIFQRTTPKSVVDSIFKQQIMQDADILAITEFNSSISSGRHYSLSFRIKCRDGSISQTQEIIVGV